MTQMSNVTHPQQRQPAERKRPVSMTLTLEGHGDHYVKRVMQWCRGWVRMTRVASLSKRPIPGKVTCRRKGQFAFQSKVMEIIT
ncbi:hypothetical protein DAPPUDRAFT_328638 [Daphnia pulex]|uniref:Uncharacterized protein n=1 Tax=Daphnia pulex TaxID=6669 RepID=E9HEB3_DAPPU|nr:hypothetical protein DAPPUDRAFT_328638 [Daphnia pulex]|eukprot:EFX69929.1 hypothetical protein DAPPUDRAFT_328638 [Daphnia pulex]